MNRALTRALTIDWIKEHWASAVIGLVMVLAATVFLLNSNGPLQEESAIVNLSFLNPSKAYGTTWFVVAKLPDGRIINLSLPAGISPPLQGQKIRVGRITQLFFGQRFVWLGEKPVPKP
jgi:hypothetical protein